MKLQIDPRVEQALAAGQAGRGAGIDPDLSRSAAPAQPRTGAGGRGGGPRRGRRAGHHRPRRRRHPHRARRSDAGPARPGRRRDQMLAARPGRRCWPPAGWGRPRSPAPSASPPRPESGSWPPAASAGCIAAARPASTSRPTSTSSPGPASPWSAAAPRSSSTCRARWRCWRPWRCRWWAIAAPAFPPSMPATADCPCRRVDDLPSLAALVRAQADLGWPSGDRVANPPPAALALPAGPAGGLDRASGRRGAGARDRRQGGDPVPAGGPGAAERRPHGRPQRGAGPGQCAISPLAWLKQSSGRLTHAAFSLDLLNHCGRNQERYQRIGECRADEIWATARSRPGAC